MFRSSDVTMSIILVGTLASPALGQTVPPATGAATAQSAQPTTVEDIVVTAQRREERLQDVPIAITAITSARLASSGVTNAGELAVLTPALNAPATQNYFQPRIRGIGSQAFGPGLENPIATYIDGVYIAAARASLLSLTDIERVEILKGPQGTLFGRNATGGLIQVITRDPKPGLGGSLDLGYGNYDAVAVDAYISGGSEKLSADLTLMNKYQGKGYGYNFARNEQTNRPAHDFGVRSKILFRPDDHTSFRLAGDYSASSGSFPTTRQWSGALPVLGAPTPGSPWDANNDYPSKNRFAGGGVSLRAERDLGTVRLVSITAYRASRYDYQLDYDTTPTPALTVTNTQHDRQFSQEVQLRSGSQSPISWLVGGYYFNAKGSFDPATVGFSGPVVNPMFPLTEIVFEGDQRSESGAAFAQTTVPLGARVRLTAGLRYTTELRTLDTTETLVIANALRIPQAFAARKRFDKLTWRAALDYRISPDLLAYASFNRGFKSGGFNVTTPDQPAFEPEQLDAYEVGVKAELFDRKLRLNPSAFYYDYSNLQVQFFTPQGQIGIGTGPSAPIYGLDLDFEARPVSHVRLFGGLSIVRGKFGRYPSALLSIPIPGGGNNQVIGDATGNQLPFTSRFSGNIGGEYSIPLSDGSIGINANLYHNSGFYSETDNIRRQPAYEQVSASIGWASRDDRLSIRAWGRNLTNAAVVTQLSASPQGVGASYQPPRTYGVTVGSKF